MTPFWQNWLRAVSLFVVALGAMMALVVFPATEGLVRGMIDLVFWPMAFSGEALEVRAVLSTGIAGAVLMGWGLMIYFAASQICVPGNEWVGRAIVSSIIVWYVVDSFVSFAAGAYLNVASNTLFALVFTLPFLAGGGALAAAGREA